MILYRHFKKEIHDIIEKDKLLSLAESVVDWKQYSDNRRTADFYEKRWNQEYIEKNKLQNVINFFGETEHLYRYQFLKFNPNSALPYHIDVNRLGAISKKRAEAPKTKLPAFKVCLTPCWYTP